MVKIVAIFGQPENITNIGTFEGKIFRFPVTLIDGNDIGTPRQSSKTKPLGIKISITAGHNGWGLSESDLIKVLFEIAKEHLTTHVNSSSSLSSTDLEPGFRSRKIFMGTDRRWNETIGALSE